MSERQLLSRATVAAALATVLSASALAQQASGPADDELEEIIVVGTQIKGADPVGSDPIVISQEEAARTGLVNTADVLRRLPQNQTRVGNDVAFQGGSANQGYNGAQVDGINLRGLGNSATLVLVDGRRVVGAGGASTHTDANQVPLAALERIEVLVDGASAVYGSDAVAGVVNFVLRKDFDGVEASVRTGDQSGGDEIGATILAGKTWDSGNILFTYEHLDRDAFNSGQIARLRQDLRPLGGPDLRIDSDNAAVGFSPNVITQFLGPNPSIPSARTWMYFGVPEGDGTGITGADLALNQPNLVDIADYKDWTGEQQRDQLAVYLNQELTDRFELFGSLTYTDRETVSAHPSPTIRVPLAGSPYFIADLPPDQIVQYSTLKDGQNRTFTANAETLGAVLGLRAELSGDWEGEAFFNYGRNEQCDSCVTGSINIQALTAQVFAGNINPLSSLPLSAPQVESVYGDSKFESRTTLEQFAVRFNGPLFALSTGDVLAAVGAEYRTESNANRNSSRTGPTNQFTQISTYGSTEFDRDIGSLFVELNIPLAENLTASAALRYDDYSDVGDTTNPKLGLTWDVTDKFSLQGTWGTSFRSPSVTDLNPNAVTSGTATVAPNWDPDIVNGVLPPGVIAPFGITNAAIMLGSNPALVPEEAETWSITAGFAHEGWDVKLTYWDIVYDDQIIFPGSILAYLGATPADVPSNGGNYGGWESLIIPVNNPATCDNSDISTADPVLQPFLESVNYDFITGGGDFSTVSTLRDAFCQVNVIIDSRIQNVGKVHKAGIDFSTNYTANVGDLKVIAQLALTHFLKNDIATQPGAPSVSEIGDLAAPNSVFEWSGTAGVTTLWKDFDASLVARYLDGMVASGQLGSDGLPGPDRNLSSYTQFDLTLGYGLDYGDAGFLDSWRIQLAITNLFDEEPDFFVTGGDPSNSAWDFKYGLPFGRTYALQLTTTF